jgi:biopolymer transport protein ExbB
MQSLLYYPELFVQFMNNGGLVMWVLFILNLLMWYGLGYRYLVLKRGTEGNVRRLIEKHITRGQDKEFKGLLDYAVADALASAKDAYRANVACRPHIYGALFPYMIDTGKYRVLVKTIVVLAPLVGLLGTVMGMIETFDALQNSAIFSQGSSISGGISKALFTTELGLVVAVPGLILGRVLDKKEDRFALEFEQIVNIIATKGKNEI